MDRIYELDKKPWISKNSIKLKDQIPKRRQQLETQGIITLESSEPDDYEKDLIRSLDDFAKEDEEELRPFFLFPSTDERTLVEDPNCTLKSYQLQLDHAKRIIMDRAYKVAYLHKLKTTRRYVLMKYLASINKPTETNTQQKDLLAVITVQIWSQPCKSSKIKLEKEVLFRADQCLTELRDQIKCQRDYTVPMDLSDNPSGADRVYLGELFKSGFFQVGDTFYNDMRDPNNKDLSSDLIDWSSKLITVIDENGRNCSVSRGIGPFKSVKMEESKFEDLEFRLGCPYLYMHQGECEHLFTISDIKYVINDESFRHAKFPYITAASICQKMDYLKCDMCKSRPPHWLTKNNSRLPFDPFLFCEVCFHSFNYDNNKQKIGQFQAYIYTGHYAIPDSAIITK